ncbi:MAG: phage holin family protein [Patescibacteria group bacterium]
MIRFLITVAAHSAALLLAGRFINGFSVTGNPTELILLGILLTILNTVVRPIVKLLAGPLIVLTLGVFSIVVNALMLFILDMLMDTLTIHGYAALLWGTVFVALVNLVIHLGGRLFGLKK